MIAAFMISKSKAWQMAQPETFEIDVPDMPKVVCEVAGCGRHVIYRDRYSIFIGGDGKLHIKCDKHESALDRIPPPDPGDDE